METNDVIALLVSQMTPTFNILENTELTPTTWLLENCTTYWLTEKIKIDIDGETYEILSVDHDISITIKGTNQPTVDSFVLAAPVFEYGTHRTRDEERARTDDKTLITPFVYLMEPFRDTKDNGITSPVEKRSDLQIFFLETDEKGGDTLRETIEDRVIKPMNAMADFMEDLINTQEDKFDTVDFFGRHTWPKFGVPEVWGNKQCIFAEPLSGVELRFTLPILPDLTCKKFCIGG